MDLQQSMFSKVGVFQHCAHLEVHFLSLSSCVSCSVENPDIYLRQQFVNVQTTA